MSEDLKLSERVRRGLVPPASLKREIMILESRLEKAHELPEKWRRQDTTHYLDGLVLMQCASELERVLK